MSTMYVEVLCPLLCLLAGGKWPWVRVLGAVALGGMHVAFGIVFRLGDFGPMGLGCAFLVCTHVWQI